MTKSRLETDAAEYGYKIKTYSFRGFEISAPDMFRKPGFLRSLLSGGPELIGPNGAKLVFAIGPMARTPSPEEHLRDVEKIARGRGHDVLRADLISVNGAEHAALTVDIPLTPEAYIVAPQHGIRLRNYFLVFPGVEYLVTCRVATIDHGTMEIHGGEENYDDIVETFRRI